jgi:hypothetical protein
MNPYTYNSSEHYNSIHGKKPVHNTDNNGDINGDDSNGDDSNVGSDSIGIDDDNLIVGLDREIGGKIMSFTNLNSMFQLLCISPIMIILSFFPNHINFIKLAFTLLFILYFIIFIKYGIFNSPILLLYILKYIFFIYLFIIHYRNSMNLPKYTLKILRYSFLLNILFHFSIIIYNIYSIKQEYSEIIL